MIVLWTWMKFCFIWYYCNIKKFGKKTKKKQEKWANYSFLVSTSSGSNSRSLILVKVNFLTASIGFGSSSSSGFTWKGNHPLHFLILKMLANGFPGSNISKLHDFAVFAGDINFVKLNVTSPMLRNMSTVKYLSSFWTSSCEEAFNN